MVTILRLLIGALRDCIMSRGRLEAEVIVLRHQLNILRRQSPSRVRPNAFDRAIFVLARVTRFLVSDLTHIGRARQDAIEVTSTKRNASADPPRLGLSFPKIPSGLDSHCKAESSHH